VRVLSESEKSKADANSVDDEDALLLAIPDNHVPPTPA
jgi:hypothetical protein